MSRYSDEDLLSLSGIQHYAFCRRQWALIHIEYQWHENALTAQGRIIHEKVDDVFFNESRKDCYITRSQPLVSYELGFYGVADMVEYHLANSGVRLNHKQGLWQPVPIEYKRGKIKTNNCDLVQVCTQAMCLEEMLHFDIPKGEIYYNEIRRRVQIELNETLRDDVRKMADDMHNMFAKSYTPKPVKQKNCTSCSMVDLCLPKMVVYSGNVHDYISRYRNNGDEI